MYKPTFDKHINLQDEKNSMIDFCNEFWTIKDKKEELVSMIDFLFDFASTLSANKFNASELNIFMMNVNKAAMNKMKSGAKSEKEIGNYGKKSDVYLVLVTWIGCLMSKNIFNMITTCQNF